MCNFQGFVSSNFCIIFKYGMPVSVFCIQGIWQINKHNFLPKIDITIMISQCFENNIGDKTFSSKYEKRIARYISGNLCF